MKHYDCQVHETNVSEYGSYCTSSTKTRYLLYCRLATVNISQRFLRF